jgi:hypothetical protein
MLRRAARFLRREAWVIVITLLALATRLYWNLVVHPPREYVFSDMQGYYARADDLVRQPLLATHDYLSFYPWGTHAFLGVIKWLFIRPGACPRDLKEGIIAPAACAPMDVGLALLGALGVFYTTLLARRLTRGGDAANMAPGALTSARARWVYVPIGLLAVFYYPFLSQSGYYLSEGPFFTGLAATTYHGLRLADLGKKRDALLFGLLAGITAIVRPQILMSLVLFGALWLFRRGRLRGATLGRLALSAVPIALILVFSAVRTTRHIRAHDPKEIALVSTNDALNYAFGRCHTIAFEAKAPGYRSFFGPPSLGALHFSGKTRKKEGLWMPLELLPALPPDPQCDSNKKRLEKKEPVEPCILIQGKMWDRDVLGEVASRCVQKTGLARQVYYAVTHVALGFGLNVVWPDSAQKLKETRVLGIPIYTGRPVMMAFQVGFGAAVLPFAGIACFMGFSRRRAREGLLAMHVWGTILVSAMYFGETRLRTPYDFVFLILGVDVLARVLRWAGRRLTATLA